MDKIVELKDLLAQNKKFRFQKTYLQHLPSKTSVPGLLKKLQLKYYPTYNLPRAPLCGRISSAQAGVMSDLFCQHALKCSQIKSGQFCNCRQWTINERKYEAELRNVKYYFNDIKKLGLTHISSQFAVGNRKCATSIDDVFWDAQKKELVLIERKSGYARLIDVPAGKNSGGKYLLAPFHKFTNCVFHHHMLQINFAVVMCKKFVHIPIRGYIVYMTPEFKHRNALPNLKLSWHCNYMNKIDCSSFFS